ncbi:MAG: PEP-CTERM sorting domain-containing protein [Sphingomonadaceae bacterium]
MPQNIAAVPEPSSYAMLMVGVGLLGLATRRRRNERFQR